MERTPGVLLALVVLLSSVGAATAGLAGATAAQSDECRFPVQAQDATGEKIVVSQEPERIVTLSPSAAQTLWEIGAQEKVVGVSQFAGFLPGAESKEVVTEGTPSQVQVEKVVELDPDLVLAPNIIRNETVERLRQADITVYRFRTANSIDDVYAKTQRIGALAGACQGADRAVATLRQEVNLIRNATEGRDRPTVMYVMDKQLYSPGPNTFIGAAIEASGGHNIAADANASSPYPQLNPEFIAQQDPEWLVVSYTAANANASAMELVPDSPALKNTTAYREGNVLKVNSNNVSQPAPRIVSPLRKMAKAFHPDAYREAKAAMEANATANAKNSTAGAAGNATATTTDATTEGQTTETAANATTTEATDSGGQPGFGVGAALAALAGAALLARLR